MISLKALLKNKLKTFLIFSSVTVSVSAIFLITAISQGVIGMYSSMLRSDGDIIVTQNSIADTFFSDIDLKLADSIGQIDGVKKVYGVIVGASPIEQIPIVGVYGVTRNKFGSYNLTSGNYPEVGEVMLGRNIAGKIKGDSVRIGNRQFKVSGSYQSEIGFEEGGVVMNIGDAGKLYNKSASFFLVELESIKDVDAGLISNSINAIDENIDARSTDAFIDQYNQFKIIEYSSFVISLLAFLMGLLGIVSVMSMIVISRKDEFGIMRALGISRIAIVRRLLIEVSIICVSAFVASLLISLGTLEIIASIEALQGYVNGELNLTIIIWVFAATLAMSFSGTLIPAWVAAKTDPVTLIRQGCA